MPALPAVQDEAFKRAADNIGVSPALTLQRKMQHRGGGSKGGKEDTELRQYIRAYLALALMDLIEEVSELPAFLSRVAFLPLLPASCLPCVPACLPAACFPGNLEQFQTPKLPPACLPACLRPPCRCLPRRCSRPSTCAAKTS